jgi:RNA polymerase sigma factor (sigma-70 family)
MSRERKELPSDAKEQRALWMERAQAGDREAYRSLLEDVSSELRAFLRRRIREQQDVEDVVQEVLLTVHRARHSYDPARAFEPWLYAIARNAAVDSFRRTRRRLRWERLADDEETIEGSTETAGGELAIEKALASLPPAQREALEMVKLEGLTVEQAAARTGVSAGALRVRIHRGYRALRARLLGEGE